MLQEVHCSDETLDLWSTEWGYYSLFCGFSSTRKSGVCIIFNINFELKVLKTFKDDEGLYISCDIIANGKKHHSCEFIRAPGGGGGGTPLQGLNGDVRQARVCFSGFLSRTGYRIYHILS